jgi:hypothetical protein
MDSVFDTAEIRSFEVVERIVSLGLQENLYLEFKSGRPQNYERFKDDIAQDVSAFANSDGGTLLVGIKENDNRAVEIDGVDEARFNRESLGQTIAHKVSPSIPGLRIEALSSGSKTVLVISVPRSLAAPHQGPRHVYYRRHEFHCQPMAHYEIEDLRRRQTYVEPLVIVTAATRGGTLAAVDVRNPSSFPAEAITFKFSANHLWPSDKVPEPLEKGMAYLGPGQWLRFRSETFSKLLAEGRPPAIFVVTVQYTHSRLRTRISHDWPVDFESYRDSMSIRSDEFQLQRDSLEEVQKIRTEISKLSSSLRDNLSTLVGTNGLDLSLYTLRNMQRISKGSPVERLAPKNLTARDIVNVLGIDVQIALLLERAFESDATIEAISTLPGMSPEIMQRVKESFLLTDG